jgi:LuxR family maltose regulon positive regulatory protein
MSALIDPIVDAKLHPPQPRPDWITRPRLLQELDEAIRRPVVLIAAPAGFGKTTLVTQWLADDSVPATPAWVSLDARDDDPDRLLTHVSLALELAGCRPPEELAASGTPRRDDALAGVVADLIHAMDAFGHELVLVLDDFHVLQDPACHRQVELLIQHLPHNAHLVISTRADPGLRLGRLRAAGRLGELRAADLAFTPDEAASMLAVEQEHLSEQALYDLVERTEGWAAGLYLAGLSMSGRADPDEFVREIHGGNRFIGDYLTEEVLAAHSPEVREFIKEVSILEQFTAPLCDAVTGKAGSLRILHDLERTNLFLIPLDESRTWFRFHHLLASVARSELEFEHPERVPLLHSRAAHWFDDHGLVDEAVMHSLASGSTDEAGRLVQANWLNYVDAGAAATVQGWLLALGPAAFEDPLSRVPAAWLAALSGDADGLEEQLTALEQVAGVGPLADGTHSVESAISLIRGLFGYDGPTVMARSAQRALELETDGRSPFYSVAQLAAGHVAYVQGDLDEAVSLLTLAAQNDAAPAIIRMLALSCWSWAAEELGHQQLSMALAVEAMGIVENHRLGTTLQASLAYTALGRAQTSNGDLRAAEITIAKGLALRRRNPTQGPWGNLHHLIAAARLAAANGELLMAQHLTDEAWVRIRRFPDGMEAMTERLHTVERQIRASRDLEWEREPLTDRELEILHLLQGSLSLTEIARELYISPNTVKTHAKSVYRKLHASSRAEAVRIARSRLLV